MNKYEAGKYYNRYFNGAGSKLLTQFETFDSLTQAVSGANKVLATSDEIDSYIVLRIVKNSKQMGWR